MHTLDVVKRRNNKNKLGGVHWETYIWFPWSFPRVIQVIFDAHSKEFIGVKLQQTVFPMGLDRYIGTVCSTKKGFR